MRIELLNNVPRVPLRATSNRLRLLSRKHRIRLDKLLISLNISNGVKRLRLHQKDALIVIRQRLNRSVPRRSRLYRGYVPEWKGVFEKYSKSVVGKNLWKFQGGGHEYEDLVQEAHVVFLTCKRKYTVENPRHFMGLFKTSLSNHFCDLAKSSSKKSFVSGEDFIDTMPSTSVTNSLLDFWHDMSMDKKFAFMKAANISSLEMGIKHIFKKVKEISKRDLVSYLKEYCKC